jgi:hypothetical protein
MGNRQQAAKMTLNLRRQYRERKSPYGLLNFGGTGDVWRREQHPGEKQVKIMCRESVYVCVPGVRVLKCSISYILLLVVSL